MLRFSSFGLPLILLAVAAHAHAAPQPSAPAKIAIPVCDPRAGQRMTRDKRLQSLEAALARDGRAAAKAFDCGNIYVLVKSGNPRAIALAVKLLRYSDAAQTAHLYDTTAMAKHPEPVLSHFSEIPRAAAAQFCVPFIPAAMARRTALNALKRTDDALAHVMRADFQGAKKTCTGELRIAERKYAPPPAKTRVKPAAADATRG